MMCCCRAVDKLDHCQVASAARAVDKLDLMESDTITLVAYKQSKSTSALTSGMAVQGTG